jgi:hypothetical protein
MKTVMDQETITMARLPHPTRFDQIKKPRSELGENGSVFPRPKGKPR